MKGLFHAHAGLGYLLIIAAVIVVLWSAVAAYRDEGKSGGLHITSTALVGLIDLQALLGIVLFLMLSKEWVWTLHHPLLMIVAAVAGHVANKQEGWAVTGWFLTSLLLLLAGAYPVVLRQGSMLMKMVG